MSQCFVLTADRVGVADRDGVVEPTNSSGQAGLAKGSGKLAALKKRLAYRVPKSPDVASGGNRCYTPVNSPAANSSISLYIVFSMFTKPAESPKQAQ